MYDLSPHFDIPTFELLKEMQGLGRLSVLIAVHQAHPVPY